MQLAAPVLAVCSLVAPALAQQSEAYLRLVVPPGTGHPLTLVETQVGAVQTQPIAFLDALVPMSFIPSGVEWIGNEIWVPSSAGLLRFTSAPITFIDALFVGDDVRHVVPTASGAMLFGIAGAIEVNFAGVEQQRQPFPSKLDVIAYQSGFLGIRSTGFELRQYDSSLMDLGLFAGNAEALVASAGFGYFPRRLTQLDDGRVAISAGFSVVLVDVMGVAQTVLNPTSFEFDTLETSDGQLFIPAGQGSCLFDLASSEAIFVDGDVADEDLVYYSSVRRPAPVPVSERICGTSQNSVGAGAVGLLLGSEVLGQGSLTFSTLGLPSGEFSLSIYGQSQLQTPFGDGVLCLSAGGTGVVRTPIQQASLGGNISTQMDLVTPGLGAEFLPGSTWYFQTLYRDGAALGGSGFNASDALGLTFQL